MIRAFRRWKAYRTIINELSSLTARELDDLGISPFQIRAIAKEHVRTV